MCPAHLFHLFLHTNPFHVLQNHPRNSLSQVIACKSIIPSASKQWLVTDYVRNLCLSKSLPSKGVFACLLSAHYIEAKRLLPRQTIIPKSLEEGLLLLMIKEGSYLCSVEVAEGLEKCSTLFSLWGWHFLTKINLSLKPHPICKSEIWPGVEA